MSDYTPPPSLTKAVKAQSRIGWDQLLKGRIAIEWGLFISSIYAQNPSFRRTESRRRFMTTFINKTWKVYDRLSTHYYNILHDDTDIDSLGLEALDDKIRFYFHNRISLFDSGDYDRFHMGLTHTLALHPTQKRDWLQTLA